MTPTEKRLASMTFEEIMKFSNQERFMLGIQMFDEFRAEIIASLPPNLSETARRRAIWERTYDEPAPAWIN